MLKRIIIRHVISIITTTLFLIVSTYMYINKDFTLYHDYLNIKVQEVINIENLEQVSDKNSQSLKSYNFDIKNEEEDNKEVKIIVASNVLNNKINNNYIKYSINNQGIHSLNMDGVIYIENLKSLESKNIDLKIWISDTYSGELNYNGSVIVS